MSKLIRNVAPLEVTIRRPPLPRIGLLSHATPPPKGQLEETFLRSDNRSADPDSKGTIAK